MSDYGIQLIPLGKIEKRILFHVMASVSEMFECPATLGETIQAPVEAFDPLRNRYSAIKILQSLKSDPARRLLVLTDLDLFIHKAKYLFGLAETPGWKGIVGIRRLQDPHERSMLPTSRFLTSIAKEAVHEIGHTFGLLHCKNNHCVMAFSRTLSDTHFKGLKFCSACAQELARLMDLHHRGKEKVGLDRPGTAFSLSDGISAEVGEALSILPQPPAERWLSRLVARYSKAVRWRK